MKTKFKNLIFCALFMFLCTIIISSPSYADSLEEDGEVIQIAIPNEDGSLTYYKGDEAKREYQKLDKLEENNILKFHLGSIGSTDTREIEQMGSFYYRYRFLKKSAGTKYGKSRRISNVFLNETSKTQKMSLSISAGRIGQFQPISQVDF